MAWFMGIDIGSCTSKGVITADGVLSAFHMLSSGINYRQTAQTLREELLEKANLAEFKETRIAESRAISYEMTLPVEMAGLFDHVGADFYPEFLNPADQFGKYSRPVKRALNLGVYGVDLSYVKMFGQHQRSVAYLNAIHRLAGEMGIPKQIYGDVLENMEFFVTNRIIAVVFCITKRISTAYQTI